MDRLSGFVITGAAYDKMNQMSLTDDQMETYEAAFTDGALFMKEEYPKTTINFLVFGSEKGDEPNTNKILHRAITIDDACNYMESVMYPHDDSEVITFDLSIYDIQQNSWFVQNSHGDFYWIKDDEKE